MVIILRFYKAPHSTFNNRGCSDILYEISSIYTMGCYTPEQSVMIIIMFIETMEMER